MNLKNYRFMWFFVGLFVLLINLGSTWAAENKTPKVVFHVNTSDDEVERILFTFKNIGFFEKNQYNVSLPSNDLITNLKEKALKDEFNADDKFKLESLMKKEIYNLKQYEPSLAKLTAVKEKVTKCFSVFSEYQKKWGFKVFPEYQINLTLYGVAGTYDCKNGIVTIKVRENGEFKKDPAETIVHEIVHIGIEESIIQKYKLPHWTKDRIVDQFMFKHYRDVFPNYQLDDRGNTTIDSYLRHPDSWERLPDYVAEYVQTVK